MEPCEKWPPEEHKETYGFAVYHKYTCIVSEFVWEIKELESFPLSCLTRKIVLVSPNYAFQVQFVIKDLAFEFSEMDYSS